MTEDRFSILDARCHPERSPPTPVIPSPSLRSRVNSARNLACESYITGLHFLFSETSLTSNAHSLTELSPPVLLLSSGNAFYLRMKALSAVCLSDTFRKPDNPQYETPTPQVLHPQSTGLCLYKLFSVPAAFALNLLEIR